MHSSHPIPIPSQLGLVDLGVVKLLVDQIETVSARIFDKRIELGGGHEIDGSGGGQGRLASVQTAGLMGEKTGGRPGGDGNAIDGSVVGGWGGTVEGAPPSSLDQRQANSEYGEKSLFQARHMPLSTPLHSTPLHSTPLSTPLQSTPLHSTLHSTPLHSTPLHPTPPNSTPLHSRIHSKTTPNLSHHPLQDALVAMLNLSIARCAQPALARFGLWPLLQLRVSAHNLAQLTSDAELERAAGVVGHVLSTISTHKSNLSIMYRAELQLKAALLGGQVS